MTLPRQKTVVVIGNGMVGHRFCERLVEFDAERDYQIVTFCEEPRPAYDRVNLTKYFEHRKAEKLALAAPELVRAERHHAVRRRPGDRDRSRQTRRALRAGPGNPLRRRRPGDRLGAVRAAGAGHRQEGRLRLPHHRGSGTDHRLRRDGQESGRDRRRSARAGSGQGGLRSRPGNARRRVRLAADAAADRRRRLEGARRQDQRAWASRSTSTRTPRKSSATARSKAWPSPTAPSSTST